MDMAHGEMAEKQFDALIKRRSRQGEVDRDENEELWKASVRRYTTRRREENRLAWSDFFERLAGALRARAEECDRRAALLTNVEEKTS